MARWLEELSPKCGKQKDGGITNDTCLPGFHHGTCPRHLFAKSSPLNRFFSLPFFCFFVFSIFFVFQFSIFFNF